MKIKDLVLIRLSDMENSMCTKVAKSILSAPRTASNAAVIAQTGIFPLSYDIMSGLLKYYRRLCGINSNTFFNAAIKEDCNVACKVSTTRLSWCHGVQTVLDQLNIAFGTLTDDGTDCTIPDCSKELVNSLQSMFEESVSNPNSKLRLYCKLKHSISTAPYLTSISNTKFRKAITQLRISYHPLNIEVGRYTHIPVDNRTCPCCPGAIEDEAHFLIHCPQYRQYRIALCTDLQIHDIFEPPTCDIILYSLDPHGDYANRIGRCLYESLDHLQKNLP
jgi:hypothetical protein